MEDSSHRGTSNSEGKNSETMSDSITSLGDHNLTDNLTSTGLSDNQQISEVDKMDDTTDVQKIPHEKLDIQEEVDEDEEEEDGISEEELLEQMGHAKPNPKGQMREEPETKSEDDNKRRGKEPITAPTADLHLVSSLKGSHKNEDKPPKSVTWSPTLEEFAPSEDETDTSHDPGKRAGKSKKKGGGKNAGGGGSKSNEQGGRKGGKNKKKGRKHDGSSSK